MFYKMRRRQLYLALITHIQHLKKTSVDISGVLNVDFIIHCSLILQLYFNQSTFDTGGILVVSPR